MTPHPCEAHLPALRAAVPALLGWFEAHRRPLPWRSAGAPDPYAVWVSEIMLQQTRIEAVIPYYERFMAAVPTVGALAALPEDALLKLWEGLGYYSRARNLHKAAGALVERHGGALPADYAQLLALPGIGEYTAGAVGSIAFGLPEPAVDGNVLRVLARLLSCPLDVMLPANRKQYTLWARALLPPDAPGAFNQALMELGERVCLPNTAPDCGSCPLAAACAGRAAGTAASLPVRVKKTARRIEDRTVLVLISGGAPPRFLLRRRPDSGLLAGLWELPNLGGRLDAASAIDAAAAMGVPAAHIRALPAGKHVFTHIEWRLTGHLLRAEPPSAPPEGAWVTLAQLAETYPLPTAFRTYTQILPVLGELL